MVCDLNDDDDDDDGGLNFYYICYSVYIDEHF